jgi:hypothetical protein
VVHGGLPMRLPKSVLLDLKSAFTQTAEKPAVGFLESLRLHRDQRVEKVKAYCSNVVHHPFSWLRTGFIPELKQGARGKVQGTR